VVGVISLVVLTVAFLALYVYRLAGRWRWIYVQGAVLALYLNVFVGVVQAFEKLPLLSRLAPTQSEPPFFVGQLVVMAIFVVIDILAVMRFRPTAASAPSLAAAEFRAKPSLNRPLRARVARNDL